VDLKETASKTLTATANVKGKDNGIKAPNTLLLRAAAEVHPAVFSGVQQF